MSVLFSAFANQRADMGTLGDFGSHVKNAVGWTLSIWRRGTGISAGGLINCFSQNSATPNDQSLWWQSNAGYSTGIENATRGILINLGDNTDTGFLYTQVLPVDFNDGNWHHHAITVRVGNPHVVIAYLNGVAYPTWAKPFDLQLPGPVVNYTSSVPIGARKITTDGGTYFDWAANLADCRLEGARIYKRALSPYEINEIFRQRGRDNVTADLFRNHPMMDDVRDIGPFAQPLTLAGGQPATPTAAPVFSNIRVLEGTRRRRAA